MPRACRREDRVEARDELTDQDLRRGTSVRRWAADATSGVMADLNEHAGPVAERDQTQAAALIDPLVKQLQRDRHAGAPVISSRPVPSEGMEAAGGRPVPARADGAVVAQRLREAVGRKTFLVATIAR